MADESHQRPFPFTIVVFDIRRQARIILKSYLYSVDPTSFRYYFDIYVGILLVRLIF